MSESSDDSMCYVDRIEERLEELKHDSFNAQQDKDRARGALTEAEFWCNLPFVRENWDELERKPAAHWESYLADKREILDAANDDRRNLLDEMSHLEEALQEAKAAGRWVCPNSSGESDDYDDSEEAEG